ncbi:AI-2E family transporter [Thomasclavelia cocleata]|jgi:predicted PurR-regulated permease PerM|uniref:AI-2E family transporter n=1 Tax=Thomasclavelia cocleata TaxID=69824 RepID=UPI00242BCBA8|nr:AI-2E family transporter [Thomasclavelia cocleata]MCI9130662.1 AI-2E family transporter [Thomasclavelia cocleata]MCI9630631.1 AI-2E family transporter [Thomasclavelia cocleata]
MKEIKLDYRKILEIVLIAIVCYWGLNNYKLIFNSFNNILSVIMPFLIGFIIAFVLNVLMIRVEKLLMRFFNGKIFNYCKRIISISLSILILIGILALVINLIIPEISNAIKLIVDSLPEVFEDIQAWSKNNGDISPRLESLLSNVDLNSVTTEFSNIVKIGFTGVLGSTVDILSMVVGGIFNLIVGFVFGFYILVSKETLKRQTHKLIRAYLPENVSTKLVEIAALSRTIFTNFIIGQTIEAIILGGLCAIGMQILGFPYAPMVGTLVGITAFVPIVGAFIGGGIGAFMIMTVDPMQAVFFIIYLIVLQQLEGDLIYPRVVGSSVGLPSIWVLFAVTVGGGLWGIAGMLFSVPVLSVVYALVKAHINNVSKN